jgi:hypothetical protein
METTKKRLRKDFAPLTVSVTAQTVNAASAALQQIYNTDSGEYEPDRSVSPLQIVPVVYAGASDGSWPMANAGNKLANIKWYANGSQLSALSEWANLYSIKSSSDNQNGLLTISYNIPPRVNYDLHFEADIPDTRLGINVHIKSDNISLNTIAKAGDEYKLSIGDDQIIQYNPFKDNLLLYDYKVSIGNITASDAARVAAIDENAYERIITVGVHKGSNVITTGYTIEMYSVSDTGTLTQVATPELLELTTDHVKLDLRLIEKADYLLLLKVGGVEKDRQQFSINRIYPAYTVEPISAASILPGDIAVRNKVSVQYDGNIVDLPDPILQLIWKTDTANKAGVVHNEGSKTIIYLDSTGIGDTNADDWLDMYVESTQKAAMNVLTDENGHTLTDENGNILIG